MPKTWRVELIDAKGNGTKKAMCDIITVSSLQVIMRTDPESFRDLVRLLEQAVA